MVNHLRYGDEGEIDGGNPVLVNVTVDGILNVEGFDRRLDWDNTGWRPTYNGSNSMILAFQDVAIHQDRCNPSSAEK